MRPPNILDLVYAVTELAPSHPEVEVWWYTRTRESGAPSMQLVLEPRAEEHPDPTIIAAELAQRCGMAVGVRLHRGAAEMRTLYRLLTARRPAVASPCAGGST
jgi:hypothetical protein